jgi:hypothetical protein
MIFNREKFFRDVEAEVARARVCYPGNALQQAAFNEEAGEVTKALIDHHYGKDTEEHIYEEMVQTGAMIVRLAEEGSQELKFQGFTHVQA